MHSSAKPWCLLAVLCVGGFGLSSAEGELKAPKMKRKTLRILPNTDARLECDVPGECVGELVGISFETTRYD